MPLTILMPDGREFTGGIDAGGPSLEPDRNRDVPDGNSFRPTEGQAKAISTVEQLMARQGRGLVVIRGYAGVGKTTMLQVFGKAYNRPLVVAPTGKAALRVQEATGLPASTIHRWLYVPQEDPKTGRTAFVLRPAGELYIPPCRLVLIDEASMVGLDVWSDIWRVAEIFGLRIVCVGDGFQLPPVKERNAPEFSLLDARYIANLGGEAVELTEVLRQALDSPVVRASMELREGAGVRALEHLPRIARADLLSVCLATRAAGGVIISHTNVTRHRINAGIRKAREEDPYWLSTPNVGEPLLILRNNYDVDFYNGEQLTFDGWTREPGDPIEVEDRYTSARARVQFGTAKVEGEEVILCPQELDGVSLGDVGGFAVSVAGEKWARANRLWKGESLIPFVSANYGYCYTAHKSQGSEWPFAAVVLEPSVRMSTEDGRRWAYTAITRAKTMAAVYYGRV